MLKYFLKKCNLDKIGPNKFMGGEGVGEMLGWGAGWGGWCLWGSSWRKGAFCLVCLLNFQ